MWAKERITEHSHIGRQGVQGAGVSFMQAAITAQLTVTHSDLHFTRTVLTDVSKGLQSIKGAGRIVWKL